MTGSGRTAPQLVGQLDAVAVAVEADVEQGHINGRLAFAEQVQGLVGGGHRAHGS